jgi:hopene-associated glycosyltransferase HpnB
MDDGEPRPLGLAKSVLWAALSLLVWLVLAGARGGFWRFRERLPEDEGDPPPPVVAVVPARNEADVLAAALRSVFEQRGVPELQVVVVDDQSTDATREVAEAVCARYPGRGQVITSRPRPDGWAPKVWAQAEGWRVAASTPAELVWLIDADIVHGPTVLRRLAAQLAHRDVDLASCMVRLAIGSSIERLLIPAFVFFFAKLYPFTWVARGRTAAAAGGCMLLRRSAFAAIGGPSAIRSRLIDDCALARRIREGGGRLWLGLGHDSTSARPYGGLFGVWSMVKRSAFTQLELSWTKLVGTVLGMLLLYGVPVGATLTGVWTLDPWLLGMGGMTWGTMAFMMAPILRAYGQPTALGWALPVAGGLYTSMTVDSAWSYARGRGVQWKARTLT